MTHPARNNFHAFLRGYPWEASIPGQAEAPETPEGWEVIAAAGEAQIDAMLQANPFDPENFGFRSKGVSNEWQINGDTYMYLIAGRGLVCCIVRAQDLPAHYWRVAITVNNIHTGHQPFSEPQVFNACLFIPNDLVGRIVLTSLGVLPRKDLDQYGKGCETDYDMDGICPICEHHGRCTGRDYKAPVITGAEDEEKVNSIDS